MNTSGFISSHNLSDNGRIGAVKTFLLPDKCFENRAACSWRRGNQFAVYPRSQRSPKTGTENCDDKILIIRQDIMIFEPVLRKLVNESNGTFLAVQKCAETAKSSDNHVELLKLSRQYRSIIRVCIENLQELSTKESDPVAKNKFLSYITIFYSVECIWHLCEILFIDNIPGDVVLPYLLEWVRFHFPCHEQTAAQLLEACERGSETHPQYWKTVIGMVVQGRVDVARALLKLHAAANSNDFKLVDNSLRSMPVFSVYGGISTAEFTIGWKHWQAECRSKLSSRTLASQPNLELILRLITGDYAAFESVRGDYGAWYDLVGGWVMYTAPWSRRRELAAAAAACASMDRRQTALETMLRALAEGELQQVISEIQQMSDNGWFATHLTDLLYHCGTLKILDRHQVNTTMALRESLILEYGATLFSHRSLWTAALSYLCSGPGVGPLRAAALLQALPVRGEAHALRLLAEAKRYHLPGVEQSICTAVGARHLSRGRVSRALWWAVRAPSRELCARAGDVMLRRCITSGPACADLLLTLGPALLLNDRLLFLGKYCEFHRLYKNREFQSAGKLLISLLTSKLTPDYFWETLLLDTLPLLESDTVMLSSEDTCEVMALLAARADCIAGDKADLLRLALVRNLARASLERRE